MSNKKRYPMPIPFGWYVVEYADELKPGDVKSVRYFAQDTDGSVLDPYVVESSPAGVFDRAAIKAVRKFLYEAPTYNGTSVKVNNVQIVLVFKLAG